MRCWLCAAAALMFFAGGMVSGPSVALARQEQANPDELNRKYEDALAQLKSAQDRKNELANENEQLKARLAELEGQLAVSKRLSADHARQTFLLRAHQAAWQSFMNRHPRLLIRWRAFLDSDVLTPPADFPEFSDPLGVSSDPWPREPDGR